MKELESNRKWREANKESTSKYSKEYHQAHREEVLQRTRQWREANKERQIENNRKWNQANKERLNEQLKQRKATDPAFKLKCNIRARHHKVLRGITTTTKGLGCDSTFLRAYISALWTEGMSWDNYGSGNNKWNIDHIISLDKIKTNPELLPKLIHYSNIQPMWQLENIRKKNN